MCVEAFADILLQLSQTCFADRTRASPTEIVKSNIYARISSFAHGFRLCSSSCQCENNNAFEHKRCGTNDGKHIQMFCAFVCFVLFCLASVLAWLSLTLLLSRSLAWLCLAWLCLTWLGLALLGLAWLRFALFGFSLLGLALFGLALLGLALLGFAWFGYALVMLCFGHALLWSCLALVLLCFRHALLWSCFALVVLCFGHALLWSCFALVMR